MFNTLAKNGGALTASCLLLAEVAFAQAQAQAPSATANSFVAIAIIAGLVLVIFFLISGALRLSGAEHDDEGSGLIEDIDEEEERERRRRRR